MHGDLEWKNMVAFARFRHKIYLKCSKAFIEVVERLFACKFHCMKTASEKNLVTIIRGSIG